jgi:steroid delta-isomerase-like uncharacterized protein
LVQGRKYEYRLEQNKDVVKRYWDGKWNKRQPRILDELQTSDVVYHSPTLNMNGIEEYKQAYNSYRTALQDTEVVIEEIIAEGDKVMTRTRLSGVHRGELEGIPPSSNRFSCISYTVFRLVHDKIAEEWELLDEYTFMRQLGAIK